MLGYCQNWGNVVAGVGVFGGQEGVVVVEFTHCHAVGPGCPLGGDLGAGGDAEDGCALAIGGVGVGKGLVAGGDDGAAVERSDSDRGVVDDAVDDHLFDLGEHLNGVGGYLGELVGELVFAGQVFFGLINSNGVQLGH